MSCCGCPATSARRVRDRGWLARTVGIKIRFADFTTVTRVRTLPGWTDSTQSIYATAAELYDSLGLDRPRVRLVGVKCENLREAGTVGEQLSFDDLLSRPTKRSRRTATAPPTRWSTPRVSASVRARIGLRDPAAPTRLRARGSTGLPARDEPAPW